MSKKEDALIKLRNVSLVYRPLRQIFSKSQSCINALHDLSFDIYQGEKLGIIGRNGAGKSTLMRLIAGVIKADSGKITFRKKVNIQLLSLGVGLERSLSGRENAILNGMLLGKSRKYMLDRVEAIKAFSELDNFFELPVHTYSSGMITRLGFSVAMEANPAVLLLDELLGVGDASFREKSKQAMLNRFRSDQTIVLISHDTKTVRDLCDRVIWVEKGRSIMEGDSQEVISAYLKVCERR